MPRSCRLERGVTNCFVLVINFFGRRFYIVRVIRLYFLGLFGDSSLRTLREKVNRGPGNRLVFYLQAIISRVNKTSSAILPFNWRYPPNPQPSLSPISAKTALTKGHSVSLLHAHPFTKKYLLPNAVLSASKACFSSTRPQTPCASSRARLLDLLGWIG